MKMCICGRPINIPGNVCEVCDAKEEVQELRDLALWLNGHDVQDQPVVTSDDEDNYDNHPAQGSVQREPIRQPDRKHGTNRRRTI